MTIYINKAVKFIGKAISYVSNHQEQYLQVAVLSPIRWTGKSVDLVELIYGLQEACCIDGGNKGISELIDTCNYLFGVDIKPSTAYNLYTSIKRRKIGVSRTYFLDSIRDKLNQKMDSEE